MTTRSIGGAVRREDRGERRMPWFERLSRPVSARAMRHARRDH